MKAVRKAAIIWNSLCLTIHYQTRLCRSMPASWVYCPCQAAKLDPSGVTYNVLLVDIVEYELHYVLLA